MHDLTKTGWRIAQGIGTPIAVIFAALSLNRWWFFVTFVGGAGRLPTDQESVGLLVLGFVLWFVLWWIAAAIITAVWGLRHIISMIALGVGLLLTIVAIVVLFV